MAPIPLKHIPVKGINLDLDETRITPDTALFIKNLTWDSNKNTTSPVGEGSNALTATPLEGNIIATDLALPPGQNYCIGSFNSIETNELYLFVWNSGNSHFIYRVNGVDGTTQFVYRGACLNFQFAPEYYIAEGRCVMRAVKYIDDISNEEKVRKFLIFTDNYNEVRFINVEESIETNFYDPVAYPYFSLGGTDCEECSIIDLAVATPMKCINVEAVEPSPGDELKQNLMLSKGCQWRVKFILRDYRESEHGIISNRYFVYTGNNCLEASNGLPRCVDLTFDIGCPLVEKIQIEFRTCTSNNQDLATDSDWFLYDTIEKYDNCEDVEWYERGINSSYNYDPENHTFTYRFCADKECQPIDVNETNRTNNQVPQKSSSVFALDKGIGLANNVRDFEPLDCDVLSNIRYDVNPAETTCEISQLRTIVIYVPIITPILYTGGSPTIVTIWKHNIENSTLFWGLGDAQDNPQSWGQYFVPGNVGFLGYLAGTKFVSESRQVLFNRTTKSFTYMGFPEQSPNIPYYQGPLFYNDQNVIALQRFEFRVPPGKYSFRIASPLVLQSEGYQTSSTNVYGTSTIGNLATQTSEAKELIIDCCEGDVIYDSPGDPTLMIYDCTFGPYTCGHLIEDEVSKLPLEWAQVVDETGGSSIFTPHTDHNGFFFGAGTGQYISLSTWVRSCETEFKIQTRHTDENYTNQNYYAYSPGGFPIAGRRIVKGSVVLCDSSIGVPGALVVCKHGPVAITNTFGEFTMLLHWREADFGSDLLILSQAGSCRITACGDECQFCFEDKNVPYLDCCDIGVDPTCRTTTLTPWSALALGNVRGLHNGGRYGVGITLHDGKGRHTFIQANESHYVDMPPLIETKTFNFSELTFNIAPGTVFPDWVRYITFSLTKNLNYEDYLMWVADKVEFIDNAGNINSSAPAKIRIYIASIPEYNEQNGFATNTNWEFTTTQNGVATNRVGDQVEFIINGDGTWFTETIKGLVTYNKEGKYFDIEYQDALADLTAGALIKLIRPKECQTQNIYYETCTVVKVDNGTPEMLSGVIKGEDAYFLNRQIPIPEERKDDDGNVVKSVIAKVFAFFFEHHSPSDFYGDHCANRGRLNVKNPYERKKRNGTEVALSAALIDRGNYNGLSYFSPERVTTFEEQQWGAIVSVLPEQSTILCICEHDNFLVGFNDTAVRTDDEGNLVAGSTANSFGAPQRKIGSNYGCQMRDINTIRKYQGIVMYMDRDRMALVRNDYSQAQDVSAAGYRSYMTKKIAWVNENDNNVSRAFDYIFIGGINPKTGEYYLTAYGKKLTEFSPVYINSELQPNVSLNETISVDLYTGMLKAFTSFTPEYYGMLEGYYLDKAVFTMRLGAAWVHTVKNPAAAWNNFYGTQGKKVLVIVSNRGAEKIKRYQYLEVYCKEHKLIADKIETDMGQLSRIKAAYWDKRDRMWCAPFLCDLNTFQDPNIPIIAIAPITDGDPLVGRWAVIRLVSENADDAKYCEVEAVATYVIAEGLSAD